MRIIIKALKRDELTMEVEPTTLVKEVKSRLEEMTKIPAANQKLLLLGRNLKDDTAFKDLPNIKDGTKLTLVEMKETRESLQDLVQRNFRKSYNEQQSKQLASKFMLELNKNIKRMSLDDIERLVTTLTINKNE